MDVYLVELQLKTRFLGNLSLRSFVGILGFVVVPKKERHDNVKKTAKKLNNSRLPPPQKKL